MGCQPQTIVARVNDKPITEQDFISGVQKVKQSSFQGQDQKLDAGAITLENKIQGILVDQCAAEPGVKGVPSEETVKAYFNEVQRKYPNVTNDIKTHTVDQDDVMNQIKTTLEMLAIGTDGAKPDDKELQAQYDKHIATQTTPYFPTLFTLKFVLAESRDQANTALEGLKKTGDFKAAAQSLGITPEQAGNMVRATIYTSEQLPPAAVKALDALTPNQYTPEPIEFTVPANPQNPQAAPSTHFMIAQLVQKVPGSTPKLAEVRELLSQMALLEKYPQWSMHAAGNVAKFSLKSHIEIMVDRYKPLLADVILPAAERNAAMSTGGAGGFGSAPGGSPGGAPSSSPGAR